MRLEVRLFAGLHRYVPAARSGEPLNLELSDNGDGYKLLEVLKIPVAEAFVFMLNGRREDLASRLADGDRIGIFPPVGGG